MFVLYLHFFCPRRFNGRNDVNFRSFVKNSKSNVCDMEFQRRTIIMSNKDNHGFNTKLHCLHFYSNVQMVGMYSSTLTSST